MPLPQTVIEDTARWMGEFAAEWRNEIPTKIHGGGLDPGGAPEMHSEFWRWLTRNDRPDDPRDVQRNPENRLRITRAMRSLRKQAPREYEVVYRVMVLGEHPSATAKWLTERAIKGGHPERYSPKDVVAICVSGVDKLRNWY